MKNNLKLGDSFEVVEVLENGVSAPIGSFGILIKEMQYSAYILKGGSYNSSCKYSDSTFLLNEEEVKPVGKLTITKLK